MTTTADFGTTGEFLSSPSLSAWAGAVSGRLDAIVVSHPNTTDVLVTIDGQCVHYDSGWRDVQGLLSNGWIESTSAPVLLRRINSVVEFRPGWSFSGDSASADTILTLPVGFRLAGAASGLMRIPTWGVSAVQLQIWPDGRIATPARTNDVSVAVMFGTGDARPSSLPGTTYAAAPA